MSSVDATQEKRQRLERAAGSKIGPERNPKAIHKLMLCPSCVKFFSDTFPVSCKTGLDSPLRAEVVRTTCTIASSGKGKKMRGRDTSPWAMTETCRHNARSRSRTGSCGKQPGGSRRLSLLASGVLAPSL